MKRRILALILFVPTVLVADGFHMNSQGIKALGMGGFATATANDASTVFYNVGAIAHLKQNTFAAGFSAVLPYTSYLDPFDGNSDRNVTPSFPFHFYGVYKLKNKFTTGFAVFTPYTVNTKWEDDWAGRYIVQEERMQTLNIQPALAYEINEHLSIGAGPILAWAHTKRRHAVDVASSTVEFGEAEYKSSGTGFGFNAGLHYIYNNISIGLNYRSMQKIKLNNGTVTYSDIPQGAVILEGTPSTADYRSAVTLPAMIETGIAYNLNTKFTATFNFSLAQWSKVDAVSFDFVDNKELTFAEGGNYDDCLSFNLGGQYQYNERMVFRAGLVVENSPVKDGYGSPASPDANKFIYSGGVSYLWKQGLTVDGGIMIQNYKSRLESNNVSYNFNGEYKTTLYILGLGISYAF